MTQYVMFQSTPEIEKAIEEGDICGLTPYKVYALEADWIVDDDGDDIIICPECSAHLAYLAQWQYCDVDGNLL